MSTFQQFINDLKAGELQKVYNFNPKVDYFTITAPVPDSKTGPKIKDTLIYIDPPNTITSLLATALKKYLKAPKIVLSLYVWNKAEIGPNPKPEDTFVTADLKPAFVHPPDLPTDARKIELVETFEYEPPRKKKSIDTTMQIEVTKQPETPKSDAVADRTRRKSLSTDTPTEAPRPTTHRLKLVPIKQILTPVVEQPTEQPTKKRKLALVRVSVETLK